MRNPNLIDKLFARLPPAAHHSLDELLRLADQHGVPVHLVGGPLRDLLLDRPSLDLDIAVEGDALALAYDLAEAVSGRAVTHPSFLTATVRSDSLHLDLITARSETYARPGALPTVKPASIREDLLRRDFTINALALRLNGPDAGEILDPAGGLADLRARLIRALHEHPFQDDASRILRAFRYASRLGFRIEPQTLGWLKRDLPYLDTISGARVHHEFSRILAEPNPEETLRRLDEIGVLAAVHLGLRFDLPKASAFARLREINPHGARAAYWPVLAWRLSDADAAGLARRLAFTKPQRVAAEAMPTLRALEPQLQRQYLKRSALADMLSPFPSPALWATAALTDDATVRDRLLDYLKKARYERPHLTGDDLLTMGVSRGPLVGDILRKLRNANLDGEVRTKRDEIQFVRFLVHASRKGGFQTRPPTTPRGARTPLAAHPEVSKE